MTANKGSGSRMMGQRVHTARGRKPSSIRWLARQLNDPYVVEAKKQGWRSRAAFKLIQIDDRFHFLKPGARVVDLGAAPGGWTQVAVQRVKAPQSGKVVAIDISEWEAVPGATSLTHDFLDEAAPGLLRDALAGPADVVLSDMAAPATGHAATDHMRVIALCEVAVEFAIEVLTPGGTFIAKVFQGGSEKSLLDLMKKHFASVRHIKPPASRPESAETYVIAMGFREAGRDEPPPGAREEN